MFKYTLDNKRYHTLNYHMREMFGTRVFKAVIDGGFSCPNKESGGCTYCREGSGFFTGEGSITQQLEKETERIHKKWGEKPIIAYFQANTNTYADVDELRAKYEEALKFEGVVGLSIATRADCLGDDVIKLLDEINKKTYLTVELGLQSVKDETAVKINRGYDFKVFEKSFYELKKHNIRTVVHIINGLIDEMREDMINTAKVLSKMEPDGVKIHSLHVLNGTRCCDEYYEGKLKMLSQEEYIDITVNQIRLFKEECVIERVTGDGEKENMVAPRWSLDKISTLGGIDKLFAELNAYQGDLYES